ncbi:histidine phosphatase family protein [Lysinibacillus sp. 2017]|uniref:histidine phosphatase family protein n=1 Tax=unclassified Lysinibacillus TaxID=2636778 RepID=UPI000D528999|nr:MULTISPECIES: histidine phosphatase family protein [unclassified Lysinibacillus]AWE07163.1 histidine phosphatase family protein [Lysinibacillus sp. 2017]TGN36917.1 histidine phosphatase family protein [Lysinibacillus sp. S2017]
MKLYIIRHCAAEGQAPDANLTEDGEKMSHELSKRLADYEIELVVSSPYKRAIDTIKPFVSEHNIEWKIDERLKERILSSENLSDWLEKLKQTYEDQNLKFTEGESSNEATERIIGLVNELLSSNHSSAAIITHGNIMSLLLNHYRKDFGFDEWQLLSNPDVFLLEMLEESIQLKRIWNK